VLAGLIADEDRTTASRVPGLGDLPMLGRLFSNQRDERNKTEIVLLITPRVLRSDATRQPAQTEFRGGTENTIGGGLAAAPFAPAMEQMQPPALPPALKSSADGCRGPADAVLPCPFRRSHHRRRRASKPSCSHDAATASA